MPANTHPAGPPVETAVEDRLQWALEIVREAGEVTLSHFRSKSLGVERKGDGSPVTVADRGAEELLRERIAARFPEDAILGEEFGEAPGTSGFRWVLDPIDGTKSFIHGVPLYTNLIGVLGPDGAPLLGVINSPATGERMYAATGRGAWFADGSERFERAEVSQVPALGRGLLLTSEVAPFSQRLRDARDVYLGLHDAAQLSRTWGDAYGYMMVATGRAEVMIDARLSLWDAAAVQPVLVEAGGTFTNWDGAHTVHSPEGLATNGLVLDEVLAFTRGR